MSIAKGLFGIHIDLGVHFEAAGTAGPLEPEKRRESPKLRLKIKVSPRPPMDPQLWLEGIKKDVGGLRPKLLGVEVLFLGGGGALWEERKKVAVRRRQKGKKRKKEGNPGR